MSAFEARYAGPCAAGDRIEPGDQVVYVNDDLVHIGCEGDVIVTAVRATERVCDICHLIRPCEHDDEGTAA